MGNADSKTAGGDESTVVTDIPGKTSSESEQPKNARSSKAEGNNKSSPRRNRPRNSSAADSSAQQHLQSRDDDVLIVGASPRIRDEQINVNLAMADLMAYLQVVANNSNHLPVTRRDDPELDRTVSALTSEEYARKSAAFVPADIRVIGGTFTRYGRVWDLPTSEEYNASDGALEPGRSYGGACCNTLLKVFYDAANDNGAAQTEAASDAIFDDDEEDEEESVFLGRSVRSGFSLDYGTQYTSAISWADTLRQMKAEFKEIGYAQIPKFTTSRKIDLNKPFSLFPENFDPSKGKKRSLLIGCNYVNPSVGAELKASHDDIRSMKDYIVNVHNFPENPNMMTVLLDDGERKPPTFLNIIEAFKALSEQSQPGDVVFVQFSGHGGRVLDSSLGQEAESYDEVIVPCDYETSGLIRDTLIFKTLLAPMRFGVTATIVIDCCDNGMVLELPYSWSTRNEKKDGVAKLSTNDDFSFVRFLKVVKTLYETSTFTQLGRTVGSALGPLAGTLEIDASAAGKSTKDGNSVSDVHKAETGEVGGSFFDALVEACSPTRKAQPSNIDIAKSKSLEAISDEKKDDKGESLFEKVINCTLLDSNEDEFSDEETFKTRTYDDHSYYEESFTTADVEESFESTVSDDEYPEPRRSSRPRRRR